MREAVANHPFTEEDLEEISYENPEGWTTVRKKRIEDQSRWSTFYSRVISNGSDFFEITWSRGSTEMQDEGSEDVGITRVQPYEKTVTEYRPV